MPNDNAPPPPPPPPSRRSFDSEKPALDDKTIQFFERVETSSDRRSFDLDNFITEFEMGWPDYTKYSPNLREGFWGGKFENRPRVRELNPEGDAILNQGWRLVELFPDRQDEEESYLLFGTPSELRTQLVLTMTMRRMLDFGGGGEWVGYPIEDWFKASANNTASVKIILLPNKMGKNYSGDAYWSKRQVSIPRPDRTKMTYRAIRLACGGNAGLKWGEWRATAYLQSPDSATQHKMMASGPTEERAKQNLLRFLPFTRCTPTNFTTGKLDYTQGARSKDPERFKRMNLDVYPAWLWVFNREILPPINADGKPVNTGKQKPKRYKMPINREQEPTGWKAAFNDAFKKSRGGFVD